MTIQVSAPLVDFTAPIGTTVDHYTATLSDGQSAVMAVAADGTLSATFDVGPGTYVVTTAAVAADGSTIGTPTISDPLTVDAPTTVVVRVPGKPTLTQA